MPPKDAKRASKSPAKRPPKAEPAAPTPSPAAKGGKTVAAQVAARRAELTEAREKLGLLSQPIRTTALFLKSSVAFVITSVMPLAKSKPAYLVGYPLLLGWLITSKLHEELGLPDLYQEPGCGEHAETQPAGALYGVQLFVYEALWWMVLGVLSSIGFGTGLHSGIMFLWPFVMQVVLQADVCRSTDFVSTYNHPCLMQCGPTGSGASFFGKLVKVLPAAVLWGVGTALGELPPYFVTRAARRTGKTDETFQAELDEAQGKDDLISKLKVWTITFTEKHGFLGVYLLASWPNAAFDMCGMACGYILMPFWTFLSATIAGKGFTKVTIQCIVCIGVFSQTFFDGVTGVLGALPLVGEWMAAKAIWARSSVMAKFELQKRFTASGLLKDMDNSKLLASGMLDSLTSEPFIDETSIAQKYCSVPSGHPVNKCGKIVAGAGYSAEWSIKEEWEKAAAAAARVMERLDVSPKDGKLTELELQPAESKTDNKMSIASLDPGTGELLSFGNLWNVFLASLILFFIVSIVDQVASMTQLEADEKELEALEAQLKADKKKKA